MKAIKNKILTQSTKCTNQVVHIDIANDPVNSAGMDMNMSIMNMNN